MKLPTGRLTVVEPDKVTGYLLSPWHPDNGGKAAFFIALGFSPDEWQTLVRAFRRIAKTAEVTKVVESSHGSKYVIDSHLAAPGGRPALVRTVWIIDRGRDTPRLVTAYPIQEGEMAP